MQPKDTENSSSLLNSLLSKTQSLQSQQVDQQKNQQEQTNIIVKTVPRRLKTGIIQKKEVLNSDNADILFQIDELEQNERLVIKHSQLNSERIKFIKDGLDEDDLEDNISDADSSDDEGVRATQLQNASERKKNSKDYRHRDSVLNIIKGVVQKNPDKVKNAIQKRKAHNKSMTKTSISVFELMEKLQKDRTWEYMKLLLAFLRKKGPFWYTKRPGFYDKLSEALVHMNNQSVDGLVDIYNLTTCYPQQMYHGFPKYSNLKSDQDQYIRGQGYGQSLFNKYAERESQVKHKPQEKYNNQVKIAAWAVPINIQYGSLSSLRFLFSLETCQTHDIFKCVVIQGFINYKWDQARWFLLVEAIIHAFYLATFNAFAVNLDARHDVTTKVFVMIFSIILLIRQFLQMIARGSTYCRDPWNLPDLGMIVCGIISVFIKNETYDDGYDDIKQEWFFVVTILLQWYRAVSYFRIWKRTRHLIHTITEIIYDMVPFLMVLIMVIFCFSSAYIASFRDNELDDKKYSDRLFQGYNILIGNVDFQTTNAVTYLVYVIMTLIPSLVLLNMLIALMGETFGRVQENLVVYDYRERLSVIIDLESVMYICKKNKKNLIHIGVIRRPGGFIDGGDEWQGTYSELKKQINRGFERIEQKIDSFERRPDSL